MIFGLLVVGAFLGILFTHDDMVDTIGKSVVTALVVAFITLLLSAGVSLTKDDADIVSTNTVKVTEVFVSDDGEFFLTLDSGTRVIFHGDINGIDDDVSPFLLEITRNPINLYFVPWHTGSSTERTLYVPRLIYSEAK